MLLSWKEETTAQVSPLGAVQSLPQSSVLRNIVLSALFPQALVLRDKAGPWGWEELLRLFCTLALALMVKKLFRGNALPAVSAPLASLRF